MGSKISDILIYEEVDLDDLKGKTLAVDAFNTLYMFLTTIRGYDGAPLMDSKGRITSHLQGLFSRFSNYLEKGLKFVFVFDGTPPSLKSEESKRRKELKLEAKKLFDKAKSEKDIDNMKKYAARAVFLSDEIIADSKKLLDLMGIPIVQAPSEGEAQAAFMAKKGDVYGVVSQDADTLLAGAPRLIKNLSVSPRRKFAGSLSSKNVPTQLISLDDNLKNLGLDIDKLIALSILVGTDYNYGGVKGIGPKKALKLLQKQEIDLAFEKVKWSENSDVDWKDIFNLIKQMPVTSDYKIDFKDPDFDGLKEFLLSFEFSQSRIDKNIERLKQAKKLLSQKGLGEFF
ncbi:MAG: flap endonuclease-1 [Candidatus Woesearchaeota archaeon]